METRAPSKLGVHIIRGVQENLERGEASKTPQESFRGNDQWIVSGETIRCRSSQGVAVTHREANRHSSLLLPGRDIDRTTALIPTDGGGQYLQQHAATLSRPEGDESSCLQVQRAQTGCRAVAWGL